MKTGYYDVTLLVDRSGSMSIVKDEVIGSINGFLADQRKLDTGEVKVSLIQFDDHYEENYIAQDIKNVVDLNGESYVPRGWTALYDAIGKTVLKMGKRFEAMAEEDRPEKVIFIIQTDGEENSSHEYKNVNVIKNMISHQTDVYSWEVVFLGSNLNAKDTATSFGIKATNAMSYANTVDGFGKAFNSVSANLSSMRGGFKADMSYTQSDYQAQAEEGITQ